MTTQIEKLSQDKTKFIAAFDKNDKHTKQGDIIEYKVITKEMEIIYKLRALWNILLNELEKETGTSKYYWKGIYKIKAGYYIKWVDPRGKTHYEPSSFDDNHVKLETLQKVFDTAFKTIKSEGIIDLTKFEEDYYEITKLKTGVGRNLI